MPVRRTRKDDGSQWTVADSRSVYGIRHWGAGYFAINEAGRVEVRPNGAKSAPIDLYEQLAELRKSGLSLPLLVRFPGHSARPRASAHRRLRCQHRAA